MTKKKPVASDVVKALECCISDKMICDKCPIQNECESNPLGAIMAKYALELINQLQTEKNEEVERAIKKFAAELKNKAKTVGCDEMYDGQPLYVSIDDIRKVERKILRSEKCENKS